MKAMSDAEKITIDFSFGYHPDDKSTIVICINNIDFDLSDKENFKLMNVLCKVICAEMIAKKMGIDMENIKF